MPGDNVELIGELVHDVAMEEGSRCVGTWMMSDR
jgi:translation elongation factor EF-Tu-like GTPase